jgi:MSHA pilin protein MshA
MIKSTQRGFTLIELVVVIIILGILAAFALPRFMGLETQARIASVRGVEGSVRSATAMAHSVWLASGSPATIPVEGATITMTNGYPRQADLGLLLTPSALGGNPGQYTLNAGNATTPATLRLNGSTTPTSCAVQYTTATATTVPPVISSALASNTTC